MDNAVSIIDSTKSDQIRTQFLELLAYLATSARGLVYEPKLYGPLRLIEAANRLIDIMGYLHLSDEELQIIANNIVSSAMLVSTDAEYCIKFTDELSLTFAQKLNDI